MKELSRFGKTEFMASPVGFGCYRVGQVATHEQALERALLGGCNVIDTSTNYTDGDSEKAVGSVIAKLSDHIPREKLLLITKVGYLQGENLENAKLKKSQKIPYPEITELSTDLWHCISPEFLEDQITRSLARLKLPAVDVLLLHNPEYFLKKNSDHREYYARIDRAFRHLEKEVLRGRIRFYGISSNTFPSAASDDHYTSLETVYALSQKIDPHSHFAVIQFPLNLYEPGAALELNNSGQSVLEFAQGKDLACMINRPLNAFQETGMIRLADFLSHPKAESTLKEIWPEVLSLEAKYAGKSIVPVREIAWAHTIKKHFEQISELSRWREILAYQIIPNLSQALELLEQNEKTKAWATEYAAQSDLFFQAITEVLEEQASIRSKRIANRLEKICPELAHSKTLSQKVIRLYRSLPGVGCVLVGMRTPAYVDDVLELEPKIPSEKSGEVFRQFLNEEEAL